MDQHAISQDQWQQIKAWVIELLEVAPAQIDHRIETLTQDPILQQALRELMAANQSISGLTLTPEQSAMAVVAERDQLQAGDMFSKFKIQRLLGSGGMGEVYLAERQDQVTQMVALKVLSRQSMNPQTLNRFETERQILAGLEHPNIARLIDAGIEGGVPFYAMEYIDGVALDVHCAEHNLDLQQRLNLFLQVCEAVGHAHKNLVVHRDLKPSNIMVNDDGDAKLLDFGIAKPLKVLPGTQDVWQTIEGLTALTPQYSAPEQINGEPITVACDVYLLGLLLYKLVTGEDAFDLADKTWGEIESIINQRLPINPSRRLQQLAERPAAIKPSQVSSDLDAIIFHALKKAPSERYQSVAEMAEDVHRLLRHQPLQIKKDQVLYRFKKHLRRHWFPITAMTTLVLVLVASALMFRQQSVLIAQERDKALVEKQTAEAVTDFLVQTFESADPEQAKGKALSAGEILKMAEYQLQESLLGDEVINKLKTVIAQVYFNLGEVTKAKAILQGIDELLGPETEFKKMLLEADILIDDRGRDARQTVADMMQEALTNNDHYSEIELLEIKYRLAHVLKSLELFEEVDTIINDLLVMAELQHGEGTVEYASWLQKISTLFYHFDHSEKKMAMLNEAVEIQEQILGHNHLTVGHTKYQMAYLSAFHMYDAENALKFALLAEGIYRQVYGEYFPKRVQLENLLAAAYTGLQQHETAVEHYIMGIELEKNHYTNNPKKIAILEYNLANSYLDNLQDATKALVYYDRVIPHIKKTRGADSRQFHFMRMNYTRALVMDGQFDKAESALSETITYFEEKIKNKESKTNYTMARALANMGLSKMLQNQWCEAKTYLNQSLPYFDTVEEDNTAYQQAKTNLAKTEEQLAKGLDCGE
ncbi:serine/threonine-protein kinase [Marinicella meishanensis]|uniref:serine/threonine-protein kinase n=1 Tax=Marinicella meishanensis TaxID=2873263 RepID=UPI001CBD3D51|nr:serine/threonine-protein kinase [Marinicella sp. NBU2979]